MLFGRYNYYYYYRRVCRLPVHVRAHYENLACPARERERTSERAGENERESERESERERPSGALPPPRVRSFNGTRRSVVPRAALVGGGR